MSERYVAPRTSRGRNCWEIWTDSATQLAELQLVPAMKKLVHSETSASGPYLARKRPFSSSDYCGIHEYAKMIVRNEVTTPRAFLLDSNEKCGHSFHNWVYHI